MRWHELTEGALPQTVYHGTSQTFWEREGDGPCYFTASYQDAANYALEACETEHYEKHQGEEIDDPTVSPIVVQFRLADLLAIPGAELEPDWGWVEGNRIDGEPTWEDSLRAVGSFCIPAFHDKQLGKVGAVV
jgi:hypothetical protein